MPLFEVNEGLVPFARRRPGPDLYEKEVEDLLWLDLEAFTGEALFPIARQATLPAGGRPDLLALDESGSVVVVEVKRDVDRAQLAQGLEYAGWARSTSLDEIAGLYNAGASGHKGPAAFFRDWQAFTETEEPIRINPAARLILVAGGFEDRTLRALDFLRDHRLPITVIPVALYVSADGRQVLNIEAEHEPSAAIDDPPERAARSPRQVKVNGRRVAVADLLEAGLLSPGEPVEFVRKAAGAVHRAKINSDGSFTLEDGRSFQSPSAAGAQAAGLVACPGWISWHVPRVGQTLSELRRDYVA
jgi:hypothetical protein